jgi:hypothetical protein
MAIDRFESTFVVDIKGDGDFTSLQPAIDALPAAGGKIFVKAGIYPITSTIMITGSNVQIQGEGMGITAFVGASAMTGNTPILEIHNSTVGTARALLADTMRGETTLQISTADAASFNPGDYVLLYSDKEVDTEVTAKHAGEIKQITAVDSASGVLTVDDQIFDTYTVAQSANVIRITMLQNITLTDFSITTEAASSTLTGGFTRFQFIENVQIQRIEVHDAFNTGVHLLSVRNAKISDWLPNAGPKLRYHRMFGAPGGWPRYYAVWSSFQRSHHRWQHDCKCESERWRHPRRRHPSRWTGKDGFSSNLQPHDHGQCDQEL